MKHLHGPCDHCGSPIQFPADRIGQTIPCPHCGESTELRLATPPASPSVPRSVVVWSVTAIVFLILGLVASFIALKQAQGWSERHRAPATNSVSHR